MIRVLQLLSVGADFQSARGAALLSGDVGEDVRAIALTIGRGGDYRGALRAAAALRLGPRGFNLVHAWDEPALLAGVGSGAPVLYTPAQPLKRGTWPWLAYAAYHEVHVVRPTVWACARQIRGGIDAARCHALAPGIDLTRIPSGGDDEIRRQVRRELGIGADEFVVLAPGESEAAANHRLAVHAVSILHVLGGRNRLLFWGRGRQASAVDALAAKLKQPGLVFDATRRIGAAVEFEDLLPAADVALVAGGASAPVLPVITCAAAGVPIVSFDTPSVRECLGPDAAALVPVGGGPRALARRLLEVRENPALRQTLASQAWRVARDRFSAERFASEYAALCRHVVSLHMTHARVAAAASAAAATSA